MLLKRSRRGPVFESILEQSLVLISAPVSKIEPGAEREAVGVKVVQFKEMEPELVFVVGAHPDASENFAFQSRAWRGDRACVVRIPATGRKVDAAHACKVLGVGLDEAIVSPTVNRPAAHPEEYRDQINPPKRILEIRRVLGERIATSLKSSEIEDWLDEIQESRELANRFVVQLLLDLNQR